VGVGAGLSMYVVVVQKFTFAISSPDEFLFQLSYVNLIRTQTEGFVHLLTCSCSTESITYSESFTYLLTCVSSPCRHVTSVLTVLYNTDTCAIHLLSSELSSNTSVYANTPSPTYRHPRRHPHATCHIASPTHCHPPSLRWYVNKKTIDMHT